MPPESRISSPSSISSSLLARVRERRPDAWQRLVELYAPLVYRWCRECGLQACDAADVAQEVFRSVWTNIDRFQRERPGDSFRGWLWTITRNAVRGHFRRRGTEPTAAGGSAALLALQQTPDETAAADEPSSPPLESGVLHRLLGQVECEFEPKTWRAFWRTTIDGIPAAEAALELQMSRGAVRQAKYRVLQRLRQELEDSG